MKNLEPRTSNLEPVLVTGGCGYIGSHVVRQLSEAGYRVVVFDNLSTGFSDALIHGEELVVGDLDDTKALGELFGRYGFKAVLHFAAAIVAPESVGAPLKYYANNTRNTLNLLQACVTHGVERFIFSSTAAVYGMPASGVAAEDSPTIPINPYGTSKLMSEWMLRDVAAVNPLRYVALRYFNVAGADPKGRSGQSTSNATHLIKVACETALGKRPFMEVFGTDYPTPDGTCIRDYIHVTDLVRAHLVALRYLRDGGQSDVFNCGYSKGFSVLQVIDAVKRASGADFDVRLSARRPGDPAAIVAASDKIRVRLGWRPQYDSLDAIAVQALAWEAHLGQLKYAS